MMLSSFIGYASDQAIFTNCSTNLTYIVTNENNTALQTNYVSSFEDIQFNLSQFSIVESMNCSQVDLQYGFQTAIVGYNVLLDLF